MDGSGETAKREQAKRPRRGLARAAEVRGIGYLFGSDVTVRFAPAEPGAGIRFERVDLPGRPSVPAEVRFVQPRDRRTALKRGAAVVELVEHAMAALAGLGVEDCVVELDAPELPGLDGSALAFAEAIAEAGVVEHGPPVERQPLVIDRMLTVQDGRATLAAYPGETDRLVLSYQLDYGPNAPIPPQSYFAELTPERFLHEIAPARTFLTAPEAEAIRASGIGARTTEADLLIFGPNGPINNCLKFPDECARHKLLDLVGDLALIGRPLAGHVVAHRSGHRLNAELAKALLASEATEHDPQPSVPLDASTAAPAMDISAILRLMPHRYPFLLLDRVLAIEPGKALRALKNVTCNEPFFPGHWPGRPVMPGVMILETMAQAAGILISGRFDPSCHIAMIVSIDEVKLRRPVVPGDQLLIRIDRFRARSKFAEARAEALVGDQIAAQAKFRFAILPAEERAA